MDVIIAVNAGSSSLKMTVFGNDDTSARLANVTVERIGLPGSRVTAGPPFPAAAMNVDVPDFETALRLSLDALRDHVPFETTPVAVGHRIVHGGSNYREPVALEPAVVSALAELVPLAPAHMPQAVAVIQSIARSHPAIPQFACFDTAFHRTVPRIAQMYPLPRSAWNAGIRRYGFHGLSCESILGALADVDPRAAGGRLIIAHLGNGSSATAVRDRVSVDTTMGFSPTGGMMMGTRSGDLDPGVLTHLARTAGCTAEALDRLVTRESGLLGVSGLSSDVQELLELYDSPDAREALALYCYIARKQLGALAAALNGIEALVFTGGIGEHASAIRHGICEGLAYLGIVLSPEANARNAPVISGPDSRVVVRVMHSDEDRVIAAHVRRLLRGGATESVGVKQLGPT